MSLFEQASYFTLDAGLQEILRNCAANKWPSQFKVQRGRINSHKGKSYEIPRDPMDLCNLIHDIMNDREDVLRPNVISRVSRTKNAVTTITDDTIFRFANREALRLGVDVHHVDRLYSCIFVAVYRGYIKEEDIIIDDYGNICEIKGIDTSVPLIIHKK